jgi:hypothetical protein
MRRPHIPSPTCKPAGRRSHAPLPIAGGGLRRSLALVTLLVLVLIGPSVVASLPNGPVDASHPPSGQWRRTSHGWEWSDGWWWATHRQSPGDGRSDDSPLTAASWPLIACALQVGWAALLGAAALRRSTDRPAGRSSAI